MKHTARLGVLPVFVGIAGYIGDHSRGTHAELLAKNGAYTKLYAAPFQEMETAAN